MLSVKGLVCSCVIRRQSFPSPYPILPYPTLPYWYTATLPQGASYLAFTRLSMQLIPSEVRLVCATAEYRSGVLLP